MGLWLLSGYPGLPPLDATRWPFWIALGAAALGVVETATGLRGAWRFGFRSLLTLAAVIVICMSNAALAANKTELMVWIGVLAVAGIAWGAHATMIADRMPAPVGSSALWVLCVAAGIVFVESHSAMLGQYTLVLASALFPGLVIAWWRKDGRPLQGGMPVVWVLVPSLLAADLLFSDLTKTCAVLIAAAPLMVWVTRVKFLRERSPRVQAIVAMVFVAIPLGIAIYLAFPPSDGY